jgi:hypothetical protein
MAKQNVTIDNEYNSKKTNVIEGSVLVMTARPSTLMWKNKVMKATDMIMKTENLTNHASQCNHAFMPISFIDSYVNIIERKRSKNTRFKLDYTTTRYV